MRRVARRVRAVGAGAGVLLPPAAKQECLHRCRQNDTAIPVSRRHDGSTWKPLTSLMTGTPTDTNPAVFPLESRSPGDR